MHQKQGNLLSRSHADNTAVSEGDEVIDQEQNTVRVPALSPSNSVTQFRKLFPGLKDTSCCFMLSMREKHCVPGWVQTDVTENICSLFQLFALHYAAILRNDLTKVVLNVKNDEVWNEILSLGECFQHALESVSSEYKITSYILCSCIRLCRFPVDNRYIHF